MMPYIDGLRVSNQEWTERYGSLAKLTTGADGENPASAPEIDPETGVPASTKAGGNRSPRSAAAAKAAIADALGVPGDSPVLADIDVSGLDAPAKDKDKE